MNKSHSWVVWMTILIKTFIIVWVLFFQETSAFNALVWIASFLLMFIFIMKISQGLTAIKQTEAQRHKIGYIE